MKKSILKGCTLAWGSALSPLWLPSPGTLAGGPIWWLMGVNSSPVTQEPAEPWRSKKTLHSVCPVGTGLPLKTGSWACCRCSCQLSLNHESLINSTGGNKGNAKLLIFLSTVIVCLGLSCFLGLQTVSAKTQKVPGKPGPVGHHRMGACWPSPSPVHFPPPTLFHPPRMKSCPNSGFLGLHQISWLSGWAMFWGTPCSAC